MATYVCIKLSELDSVCFSRFVPVWLQSSLSDSSWVQVGLESVVSFAL